VGSTHSKAHSKTKGVTLKRFIVIALLVLLVLAIAPAAFAGQNAVGAGFSSLGGDTGGFISGDVYGNTSNPSGNGEGVLPSLAPGPWKCDYSSNGCAGPTDPGGSMGDFLAPVASDGQSQSEFANGNDLNLDFSGH